MAPFLFTSTTAGDYDTPEQFIPLRGLRRAWEVNMTMSRSFGYKKWDNNWKTSNELILLLQKIIKRGGNFLLNIGPTAEGEIPKPSVDRLLDIGKWIINNRDSIYFNSSD